MASYNAVAPAYDSPEIPLDSADEAALHESALPTPALGDPPKDSKKAAKLARLAALKAKRTAAKTANHVEVVEEDKRAKLPSNWEAKKRKVEWEMQEEEAKKAAEAKGVSYERVQYLKTSVVDAERLAADAKRRNTSEEQFAGDAANGERRYVRKTDSLRPDMQAYKRAKAEWGDDFYAQADSLSHGTHGKVTDGAADRLATMVAREADKKRKGKHKLRDPDANVDHINDGNMRFNRRLDRAYGVHTAGIKADLERGTAL